MCGELKDVAAVNTTTVEQGSEALARQERRKQKVVVVMGATGTGKSRLAVELAKRFFGEVINSDKIQVHEGLPVLTNKITDAEKRGVPHHLLGVAGPEADITPADFRDLATRAAEVVAGRGGVPIVAGGSNSYLEALVEGGDGFEFCFLWLDVSSPVLHSAVSDRVDKMVKLGMEEEARGAFDPAGDYSRGVRRAIGVPELDAYFRAGEAADGKRRAELLREAISETKTNTCKLASRQRERIDQLRNDGGWKLHRIDATPVLRERGAEAAQAAWEQLVEIGRAHV